MDKPRTAFEILRGARALIAAGWCREDQATDEDGNSVDFDDPAAKHFCALGALERVSDRGPAWNIAYGCLCDAANVKGERGTVATLFGPLVAWNDREGRTRAQVVAAFDEAMKIVPKPRARKK
jgi:hypothetical protein